eukprot:GFYU01003469.1.p2 GENE.GFYU01003469.1~~GFYU01003469.1.p2  ORF type:complete len:103 (+),score=9.95 GFYU01003469.1:348-656(+)
MSMTHEREKLLNLIQLYCGDIRYDPSSCREDDDFIGPGFRHRVNARKSWQSTYTQIASVVSSEAETIRSPVGDHATSITQFVWCCFDVHSQLHVEAFQIFRR